MFQPVTLSFTVPMLVPNPLLVLDAYVQGLKFWSEVMKMPTHEVIDWPLKLKELPERPEVDPENLPLGVLRFGD